MNSYEPWRNRLGANAATYVAGLVALMYVYLIAAAIEHLHNSPFPAGVYLLAATTSVVFSPTFFFGCWACGVTRVGWKVCEE